MLQIFLISTFVLSACGGGDDDASTDPDPVDPADLTGTFDVLDMPYACEVTTQLFEATGEYSVLCQNDNAGLVQITFKDEASARRDQAFTITKRSFSSHPDADTIDVSYLELGVGINVDSEDDFAGAAAVAAQGDHHVLTLTDVLLEDSDGVNTQAVSATINF